MKAEFTITTLGYRWRLRRLRYRRIKLKECLGEKKISETRTQRGGILLPNIAPRKTVALCPCGMQRADKVTIHFFAYPHVAKRVHFFALIACQLAMLFPQSVVWPLDGLLPRVVGVLPSLRLRGLPKDLN